MQRYLDAVFEPGDEPLRLERSGTIESLRGGVKQDLLARAFVDTLEAAGVKARGVLRVYSEIPVARGLGSSAAATVAGLLLATAAMRSMTAGDRALLEPLDLVAAAAAREGHMDNVAPAVLGGLVAAGPASSDGPRFRLSLRRLTLSPALGFAFAAPDLDVSTKRARAALPDAVPHAVAARSLARAIALVQGLANADEEGLRVGFEDELHVPYRLPLIPGAISAFDAARGAGAWAATISGSGSGVIAVCPAGKEGAVAEAMRAVLASANRGAALAFPVHPEEHGARLIEPEA